MLVNNLSNYREERQNKRRDGLNSLNKFISTIQQQNAATALKISYTTNFYGFGLAWFTVFLLILLIIIVKMKETLFKQSGINQIAIPSQSEFEMPLLGFLFSVINDRIQTNIRNRIIKLEASGPTLSKPIAPAPLFNYSGLESQTYNIISDEAGELFLKVPARELLPGATSVIMNPEILKMENEIQGYLKTAIELKKSGQRR